MITRASGRGVFKIGTQRLTDDITVVIKVGIRMAQSAERKRTMENGTFDKRELDSMYWEDLR